MEGTQDKSQDTSRHTGCQGLGSHLYHERVMLIKSLPVNLERLSDCFDQQNTFDRGEVLLCSFPHPDVKRLAASTSRVLECSFWDKPTTRWEVPPPWECRAVRKFKLPVWKGCAEREEPSLLLLEPSEPSHQEREIFGHSRPTRFNQEKIWGNKSTVRTKAPSVYCTHNYSSHSSRSFSHHGTDTSHSHRALPEFLLSVAGLRKCLVFYCPRYGGGLLHSKPFENLM